MDNRSLLDDTKELVVTGQPKEGKGEGRFEFRIRLGAAAVETVEEGRTTNVRGEVVRPPPTRRRPTTYQFRKSVLGRSPIPPKVSGPVRRAINKGQTEGTFELGDWSFAWELRAFAGEKLGSNC